MPTNLHHQLLLECRELFRERLLETMRSSLDAMDKSLMELADRSADFESRNRYLDARDIAVRHRENVESHFEDQLLAGFQDRVESTKPREEAAEPGMEDFQLVLDDDLNETLSFNNLAAQIRRHCDDDMSALDQRVAVLLGRERIEGDVNPFGAKVVSEALRQACQQVDVPLNVRLVFMKSFETLAMDGIRSACHEVNDVLVSNDILPRIRYGVPHQERREAPAGAKAADAAPAEKAVSQPAEEPKKDTFEALAAMLGKGVGAAGEGGGGRGAGGNGAGGEVARAPSSTAEIMGSLTKLQRGDVSALDARAASQLTPILADAGNLVNVLRHIRQSSVGAAMGEVDSMTLEIVSMLFDALFDDPKLSLAMKGLVGRLQLPILKVALADKELFSGRQHPARRLLDALGQLGQRLPRSLGADSPVYKTLEGHVDALLQHFQDNVEVFDTTRLQVEALIAAEDAQIAVRMQATQREMEQVERLALAKSEVQDELRAKVAKHAEMPHAVFEFLGQQWIKYLMVVHARDGKESGSWKAACEVTDQLLWSVQTKPTIEDHRALTRAIPALLVALRAGVKEGGIADEVAGEFYQRLMECHTAALRSALRLPAEPVRGPKASTAIKPPPPTALDFTRAINVESPFGGGKVEVSDDDLDFTGHAPQPVKRARPAQKVRLPAAMVVDAWVRIEDRQAHTERPARLHYVSPLKSHFLFVDRQGNKVYECSRSMLAKRLSLGEVVLLDGEPDESLFDRILEALFGKLGRSVPQAEPALALT